VRREAASVLAVLVCAMPAGCRDEAASDDAPADAPAAVAVQAAPIASRTFREVVTAAGHWRSTGNIDLTAPFAGAVDSLAVRPGDRVESGQVLGSLVSIEARAEMRGAALLAASAHDSSQVSDARQALDLARRDLVRVPLTAPAAGTLVELAVAAGGEVAADERILTIVPARGVIFEAHVEPVEAARIRPGQDAEIREAGRTPVAAVVDRILPVADATDQSSLVWLEPRETGMPSEIGRFGTAVVTVGAPHASAAVPLAAVVEDDLTGQTRVAVVSPDRHATWTPVTLGAESSGWRELVSPALEEGTLVITAGHRGLPDGTAVTVTP
jgi:multidrug efflux pump subunit AcrA (membrane-fusion protein)